MVAARTSATAHQASRVRAENAGREARRSETARPHAERDDDVTATPVEPRRRVWWSFVTCRRVLAARAVGPRHMAMFGGAFAGLLGGAGALGAGLVLIEVVALLCHCLPAIGLGDYVHWVFVVCAPVGLAADQFVLQFYWRRVKARGASEPAQLLFVCWTFWLASAVPAAAALSCLPWLEVFEDLFHVPLPSHSAF